MNNDKDYTAPLWLIIGLLFLILVSTGCAARPTLEDMMLEQMRCETDCEEINERVQRRIRRDEMRENVTMSCPQGFVAVCDTQSDRHCGARYAPKPLKYACVRARALGRMLGF